MLRINGFTYCDRIVNVKINFTKKQYRTLIEMLYIADWVANAIRLGTKEEPYIEPYRKIEQYVYSFFKLFASEDLVEYSKEFEVHFPTLKLEEETKAREAIEEYNEHEFWEELFERLVEKDMISKYGISMYSQMTWQERIEKEEPFRKKWDKELQKYGLARLYVES